MSCASASTCSSASAATAVRAGCHAPSQVLPGAPTIGAATSAYTAANVSWTAGSTGGGTITGYTLNAFNETTSQTTTNACPASTTSTATSCTVTGLTEGDSGTFTVAAINAVGQGPFSSPSTTVIPAPTPPAPPTSVTAVATGSSATVNWSAGATNGDPITGYVVSSSAEGVGTSNQCPTFHTSTSTSCVLSNLINGDSYTFSVQALNAAGAGGDTAANPVAISYPPLAEAQSPLTITSLTGPAFNGASSSSLPLTTSGGSVAGLDLYGVGGQQICCLNTNTNSATGLVNTGANADLPSAVAVNPAGTFVYVVYQETDNVQVINTTTQQIVSTIPVGDKPPRSPISRRHS